jgi:hypothetical protein
MARSKQVIARAFWRWHERCAALCRREAKVLLREAERHQFMRDIWWQREEAAQRGDAPWIWPRVR